MMFRIRTRLWLSKYAVGCYLRYCWFPRRTLTDDTANKPACLRPGTAGYAGV